jgi:hypothetical protein
MQARSTIVSAAFSLILALALLSIAVGAGLAAAGDKRPVAETNGKDPEVVRGTVTKADPEKGRVTVRGTDGGDHELAITSSRPPRRPSTT